MVVLLPKIGKVYITETIVARKKKWKQNPFRVLEKNKEKEIRKGKTNRKAYMDTDRRKNRTGKYQSMRKSESLSYRSEKK